MVKVKFSANILKGATERKPSALYSKPVVCWSDNLTKEQREAILADLKTKLDGRVVVAHDVGFMVYKVIKSVKWYTSWGNQIWYEFTAFRVNNREIQKHRKDSDPIDPNSVLDTITMSEFKEICRKKLEAMLSK